MHLDLNMILSVLCRVDPRDNLVYLVACKRSTYMHVCMRVLELHHFLYLTRAFSFKFLLIHVVYYLTRAGYQATRY